MFTTIPSRNTALLPLLVAFLLFAQNVGADVKASERAVARELGKEAIAAFQSEDYPKALDRISRAHDLVDLTTTGLWRARCLAKLGRLVEAAEQLRIVTRMSLKRDAKPVHAKAKREAASELAQLDERIPRLRVRIVGELPADTQILIDGKAIPSEQLGDRIPLDPGEHLVAVAGGGLEEQKRILFEEGDVIELPLRMEDRGSVLGQTTTQHSAPLEQSDDDVMSTQALIGWIVVGVGGAALIAGAITGGLALDAQADLDDGCPDRNCEPAFHGDVDRFESLRTISTATLIGGAALAITGITLVITAPSVVDIEPVAGVVVTGAF